MKKLISLFTLVLITLIGFAQSPGDTIVVQSLHHGSAVRDTTVNFPTNPSLTYSKILMKYNMRCKDGKVSDGADRNKGCGEWDYSCNTYIHDDSKVDSLWSRQISNTVTSFSGDTFFYTTYPMSNYYLTYQVKTNVDSIISENQLIAGHGNKMLDHVLSTDNFSGRSQHLYRASELTIGGVVAGNIDGVLLNSNSTSQQTNFLRVRMKHTSDSTLSDTNISTQGFTEVYFYNTTLVGGLNRLQFHTPFSWNGTSNVIVEYSFTNNSISNMLYIEGDSLDDVQCLYTSGDRYLNFNGANYVESNGYKGIGGNTARTVEAWIKADVGSGEIASWGRDAGGQKWVFMIDGGGKLRVEVNGGYRVGTSNVADGQWHHVAATFAGTNVNHVKLYVDGVLEAVSANQGKGINTDVTGGINLRLSRGINNRYFRGIIDEVRLWDTLLTANEMMDWMYRPVNSTHSQYAHLQAWYSLNDGGNSISDMSGNGNHATAIKGGQWDKIYGVDLFKEWKQERKRANAIFVQGNYFLTSTVDTILDTVRNLQHSVTSYTVYPKTGTDRSDSVVGTTNLYWQSGYEYFIDTNGNRIDSNYIGHQAYYTFFYMEYYRRYPMRFEIMSFVTPYGIGLNLTKKGKTWTFDLTDFAPILKGDKRLTMEWGGQWQEEMDIQFLFIVGTPPRDVIDIDQIWRVTKPSYSTISQDLAFEPRNYPLSSSGAYFKVRSAITGHGQEGEFIPRAHHIDLDNNTARTTWQVWKACADNPIYPQGGTWVYDRAGWCPGAATDLKEIDITADVSAGSSVRIDYGMANATGASNYIVSNQLVTYGTANFTLDATVKEIKAPTGAIEYFRTNYICGNPSIVIQNTGSITLTSVDIKYWINDSKTPQTYSWTGSLAFLEEAEVSLPSFPALWEDMIPAGNRFFAEVTNPNSSTDEYVLNNKMSAEFEIPDVMPQTIAIRFKTNNAASENEYFVKGKDGSEIFRRSNLSNNTEYKDTFNLVPGCYQVLLTDSDGDGIDWWANNDGSGFFWITDLSGKVIKAFEPDFGGFYEFNFTTDHPLSYEEIQAIKDGVFNVYPNPASTSFTVELNDLSAKTVRIYNSSGQKVDIKPDVQGNKLTYNTSGLSKGIYLISVESDGEVESKRVVVE